MSDPLSAVLQDLRLSGVSYGRCGLTRPWGIDFRPQAAARFHFVADGECWLQSEAVGEIQLRSGDIVLLPHGAGHTLSDTPHGPTRPLESFPVEEIGDRTYRLHGGGGGPRSLLFCGTVTFEEPAIHPLLELMPPALLVRGAAAVDPTLLMLLNTMAAEVIAQRVGSATILTRLADVVITKVIRAWVEERRSDTTGWLAAIRDPTIGRALAAIHQHPSRPWSVGALAEVARTSRSTFAERFTTIVGVPAARYVMRWRMHLASAWLRRDRMTVAQVATRLGYESEASFSRAFKRLRGVPPSTLRRASRTPEVPVSPAPAPPPSPAFV